jgi:uncharacterized protein
MEMLKLLPKILDAEKLARKNSIIEGYLLLSSLNEVSEYKSNKNATVTGSFKFYRNKNKRVFIDGVINTELQLVCQRCMQLVLYPISSKFTLACIDNQEKEVQLSEQHEFVLLNNGKLAVSDMLQEEILLAMPIVAYHDIKDCAGIANYSCKDKSGNSDQCSQKTSNSKNPFAILKHLKCD